MAVLSKCPDCGGDIEYWQEIKYIKTFETMKKDKVKDTSDEKISNYGYKCKKCPWGISSDDIFTV